MSGKEAPRWVWNTAGDRHGSACTWDSLGHAHHQAGSLARAAECYEQALEAYREIGDRYGEADTLEHLGDTRFDLGDPTAAGVAWRLALDIMTELDHPTVSTVTAKLRTLRADWHGTEAASSVRKGRHRIARRGAVTCAFYKRIAADAAFGGGSGVTRHRYGFAGPRRRGPERMSRGRDVIHSY